MKNTTPAIERQIFSEVKELEEHLLNIICIMFLKRISIEV